MIYDPATPQARASAEFYTAFTQRAKQARRPLSCSFEITTHCNLDCRHCYLGDLRTHSPGELDTRAACAVIDKIAEAGCLFLLLTGGEPMLRPDFPILYRHAKECGLAVRVFTNGTRITPDILRLFQDYPPLEVEISLYGATPEIYRAVTGSERGFHTCVAACEALVIAGIRLKLKTVVMRQNQAGLPAMKALAARLGVPFRFDTQIFPTLDCGAKNLACRLEPEAAAGTEIKFSERPQNPPPPAAPDGDQYLYQCGAAKTGFAVNARGQMLPCTLIPNVHYDLAGGNFADGWRHIGSICELKVDKKSPCGTCTVTAHCHRCPPRFGLESGGVNAPPKWLCDLAAQRARAAQAAAAALDINQL